MPSIYVYYDFGSQTIGICPKRGKLYAKIPGKNRCSRSESGILQPASRTGLASARRSNLFPKSSDGCRSPFLNKIPSKSVKNEQKALANPANRIN